MSETIPVWVAGNTPLVPRYIRSVLRHSRNVEVFGCGDTPAREALPATRRCVLVIDQAAPAPLAAHLRPLRSQFPRARILILGKPGPDDELCRLLVLGIHGFVPYNEVEGSLRQAVEAVWSGRLWVPPELLGDFVRYCSAMYGKKGGGLGGLTPRETLVVQLLQQRFCDKEISTALNISEATVKFHVKNIFRKLGVHDRRSAAELAKSTHLAENPVA